MPTDPAGIDTSVNKAKQTLRRADQEIEKLMNAKARRQQCDSEHARYSKCLTDNGNAQLKLAPASMGGGLWHSASDAVQLPR